MLFSVDGIEVLVNRLSHVLSRIEMPAPKMFLALDIAKNRKDIDVANREDYQSLQTQYLLLSLTIFYMLSLALSFKSLIPRAPVPVRRSL